MRWGIENILFVLSVSVDIFGALPMSLSPDHLHAYRPNLPPPVPESLPECCVCSLVSVPPAHVAAQGRGSEQMTDGAQCLNDPAPSPLGQGQRQWVLLWYLEISRIKPLLPSVVAVLVTRPLLATFLYHFFTPLQVFPESTTVMINFVSQPD